MWLFLQYPLAYAAFEMVQSQYWQQPLSWNSLKLKTILHFLNFIKKIKGYPIWYWGWKQSHPAKHRLSRPILLAVPASPKATSLAFYCPMRLQKCQRLSRETQRISVRLASAHADVYRRSKPIGPRRCPSACQRGSTDRKLKKRACTNPSMRHSLKEPQWALIVRLKSPPQYSQRILPILATKFRRSRHKDAIGYM